MAYHISRPANIAVPVPIEDEHYQIRVDDTAALIDAMLACQRAMLEMRYDLRAIARWYAASPRPARRPDDCVALTLRALACVGVTFPPRSIVTPLDLRHAIASHPREVGATR